MPGEAEAGQEGAGLGPPAANPGEVGDPLDGLRGGADGPLGEGRLDGVGVVGEMARGAAGDFPALEAVESAVAVGEDGPLRGGNADVGEASRVLPGMPEVDGPEDVRRAADDGVGGRRRASGGTRSSDSSRPSRRSGFAGGVFESVEALEAAIESYSAAHNANPKPFVWAATADLILRRVEDVCKRTCNSGQ